MPFAVILIGLFLVCFLLGSIPWGVVISRVFYRKDVRDYGSGNIGTTNSFRALGKVGGSAVFVLDFGKGFLSAWIAVWTCQYLSTVEPLLIATEQVLMALSFLACVWGHIYSPWLHFKGGKGIAVAIGALFVVFGPLLALLELVVFAVLVALTRKVSVGSLASSVLCPLLSLYVFAGNWLAWLFMTLAAVSVIWAHRTNIERLVNHTESTIRSKDQDQVDAAIEQAQRDVAQLEVPVIKAPVE